MIHLEDAIRIHNILIDEFVMAIVKGKYDYNQIKDWISNKLTPITK